MQACEAKRLRDLELESSKRKRLLALRMRCLTMVQNFSPECVDIAVNFGPGNSGLLAFRVALKRAQVTTPGTYKQSFRHNPKEPVDR